MKYRIVKRKGGWYIESRQQKRVLWFEVSVSKWQEIWYCNNVLSAINYLKNRSVTRFEYVEG